MKNSKRLVIMASGQGSNFEAIAEYIQSQHLAAEIVGLICDRPEAYVLTRAQEMNIPRIIVDRNQYQSNEDFQQNLLAKLQQLYPDFVILAGFMRILSPSLVNAFRGRMVNIHPALLPKFPGLHTHERVFTAREEFHGTTVHFVTAELDAGPIIAEARFKIKPNDTPTTLKQRVHALEHQLYPRIVAWLIEGRLQLTSQGVLMEGRPLPLTGYQYVPNAEQVSV